MKKTFILFLMVALTGCAGLDNQGKASSGSSSSDKEYYDSDYDLSGYNRKTGLPIPAGW